MSKIFAESPFEECNVDVVTSIELTKDEAGTKLD
jgi:hypothetical protein